WGWFEIVEKPIFKYLDWLFRMIGNFGVAIILLTVTIRTLIFPVAQRQFASMAAMKAIQPKMKAIQEKYKDDKARAQQE
ncbi:YidC/Oxa1 family membrane protein insertase, partial [Listeria monocytogenes]|nr:YidC/Oxa1 family membrane protein insertase [Listeria monocytogenes]